MGEASLVGNHGNMRVWLTNHWGGARFLFLVRDGVWWIGWSGGVGVDSFCKADNLHCR